MDERAETARGTDALRPIWWFTVGYPVWWIVGVADIAVLTVCAMLAFRLIRQRRELELPRGSTLWLLFLVWVVVGVVVLQVSAPGTQTGFQATRYVTWAFRVAWYLGATVVLLYVLNLRHRVPVEHTMRAFSALFFTLVAGGFVGALFPETELRSLLELILPQGIANIESVRDLIHPTLAQTYTFEGTFNPRPSAPFPYTNDWGVTYACTVPLFIVGWIVKSSGTTRFAGIATLVASTVPVVLSQNRGLWLALLAMLVFVGLKFLATGHFRALALASVASVVVVVIVMMTPLSQVLFNRVSSEGGSDQGRQALGTATVVTVLDRAPISGLGTTRTATSSFSSIALADSATCARCTPPALGTQGQLWLVIFSQGVIGLAIYLAFLLVHLLGALRQVGAASVAAMAVVIGHLATMPFYNAIGPALLMIFASCAVLETRRVESRGAVLTLQEFLGGLRARARITVLATVAGVIGWLGWHAVQAPRVTVSTLVYLPVTPGGVIEPARQDNLDLGAAQSRAAVGQPVAQAPGTSEAGDIVVSAIPNSRILKLSYTASSADTAQEHTDAAASALLEVREDAQSHFLDVDAGVAARAARSYAEALTTVSTGAGAGNKVNDLERQLTDLQNREIELRTAQGEPVGSVVGHTLETHAGDDRVISTVSGGLLGLLTGVLLSGRVTLSRRGLQKRATPL